MSSGNAVTFNITDILNTDGSESSLLADICRSAAFITNVSIFEALYKASKQESPPEGKKIKEFQERLYKELRKVSSTKDIPKKFNITNKNIKGFLIRNLTARAGEYRRYLTILLLAISNYEVKEVNGKKTLGNKENTDIVSNLKEAFKKIAEENLSEFKIDFLRQEIKLIIGDKEEDFHKKMYEILPENKKKKIIEELEEVEEVEEVK